MRLGGDWGEIGWRLGEAMACLALFFGNFWGNFFFVCKTNFLRTAGNLVGAQRGEPGFECKSSLGI